MDLFDVQRYRVDAARRAEKIPSLDEVQPDPVPLRRQSALHGVKEARFVDVSRNRVQQIRLLA